MGLQEQSRSNVRMFIVTVIFPFLMRLAHHLHDHGCGRKRSVCAKKKNHYHLSPATEVERLTRNREVLAQVNQHCPSSFQVSIPCSKTR